MMKLVVITGSGSGLGAELAKEYSKEGNHVVLLGRNMEKLKNIQNQLENTTCYSVDVSKKESVSNIFHTIENTLGKIDVLINAAGIGTFDLAENISELAIHQMIDTNLKGTIFCTQEVLPRMKKNNSGLIVNIVSTAGLQGKVNESVYCASKFGVKGFTDSLNLELKTTDINICGVYMGGMETDFWDGILTNEKTSHFMKPSDVASLISANMKQHIIPSEIVIKSK